MIIVTGSFYGFYIWYYLTLCTYKKHDFFLFLIHVFWGVDSKSEIHFFGRYWKTLTIRKKIFFPDYRGFPMSEEKNKLQNRILHVKSLY